MEHPRPVIAGRADIDGVQLLESCAYTWVFDGAALLFRRMPRDATVDLDVPRAWLHTDPSPRCYVEWQPLSEAMRSIRWWKQRLNVVDQRFPRAGRHQLFRPFGGWPAGERAG
ncbi:MAG: hypothetical protein LC792_17165 [Actinobacteria bacterium]|nr:hypothetical protein [Actinomycetota bacterium]